jgi:ABC-2 type transport system ATP-binding protein
LLTTHYLEEAEELCDEIAIIHHGDIIARDSTEHLMQGVDGKEIILTLATPLQEVPAALSGLQASIKQGRLAIQYQPSLSQVGDILARVQQAGLAIRDVSIEEIDLEDVFVQMTSDKVA